MLASPTMAARSRPLSWLLVVAPALAACVAHVAGRGTLHITVPPQPAAADTRPPPPVRAPDDIAGAPVTRVGINFEDQGAGGDADYNDAVLCFAGHFKVDGTSVISTQAQQVVATTSSISACRHVVRVDIYHPDGRTEQPIAFESSSGVEVPMRFELGSRLEVSMQSVTGGCNPVGRTMHEPDWARVQLDRCNTTGR